MNSYFHSLFGLKHSDDMNDETNDDITETNNVSNITNETNDDITEANDNTNDTNEQSSDFDINELISSLDDSSRNVSSVELKQLNEPITEHVKHDFNGSNVIHVIYSFIKLPFTDKRVYDLSEELEMIINEIHSNLPNQFTTSTTITEQLINKLTTLIDHLPSQSQTIFYLYVPPITAPFNLFKLFNNKHFKPHFINPTFELLLSQITNNYKQHPFRVNVNQSMTYILKNYIQAQPNTSHSIKYDHNALISSLQSIKSAFINETDFNEFLETFEHTLLTKPDNENIIFKHIMDEIDVIDIDTINETIIGNILADIKP